MNFNESSLTPAQTEGLAEFRAESKEIRMGKSAFIKELIASNSNNIKGLFALRALGNFPVPDARDEESWEPLFQSLSTEIQECQIGTMFRESLERKKESQAAQESLKVGDKAPDFTLPDADGNELSLYSILADNRLVVLDFWASWCGPCRGENPALLKAYNQFNKEGVEVVAVSLDESRKSWLKAVKEDGMPWYQLSDLKGYESPVVKLYGVQGIPQTYILNSQGVIVASNVRGYDSWVKEFQK